MSGTTARIELHVRALEPIHHGEGVSGNTSRLRQQRLVHPETVMETKAPIISGSSFKHMVREHGALHALEAMGVTDNAFRKEVVDLIFSGGALNKAGAVDLELSRKVARAFPILSLCGYAAGNTMSTSKLRVDNLHLVCEENAWRAPASVADTPQLRQPKGRFIDTEFGTRHELFGRPQVRRLLTDGEVDRITKAKSAALAREHADKGDSQQMIYDFGVIKPGSLLWGELHLLMVSEMELAAFWAALRHACEGATAEGKQVFRVGAKGNIGYGKVAIDLKGKVRERVVPTYTESEALSRLNDSDSDVLINRYSAHLRDNRDEILCVLDEAVGSRVRARTKADGATA